MSGLIQALRSCPAVSCTYVGPSRALSVHWRVVYESHLVLHLCPLQMCTYQTPHLHNLRPHWEWAHGANQVMSAELRTLPLLADFVVNRNRMDPGACCPPVAPLRLPVGSLPHSDKSSLLVWVQVILAGQQLGQRAAVQQQHPAASGVVPETPDAQPPEESIPVTQPDAPEVVEIDSGESDEAPEEQESEQKPVGEAEET